MSISKRGRQSKLQARLHEQDIDLVFQLLIIRHIVTLSEMYRLLLFGGSRPAGNCMAPRVD